MATRMWDSNPKWPWPCEEDISKYLNVPDYYLVGYEEVRGFLRGLQKGRIDSAGTSAGGRDLTVVYYGPSKPERTLCVTGSTHGTEVEGVASVINAIRMLDAGSDLRGEKWGRLQNVARKVGFYLMPFYNPDAAARAIVKSYVDMPFDAVNHLHVGFWKNGRTLNRKIVFGPWTERSDLFDRLDRIAYLGARYNDAGADINRCPSGRKSNAVETQQMLKYLKTQRVDCYMDMHSHSTEPWLGRPAQQHYKGDYDALVKLQDLTAKYTKRAGGPELALAANRPTTWYNSPFFAHNLGIYGFTYEELAGFKGNFPPDKPLEEIWLENTYNGLYTILGLAEALLEVPSAWE
jgi:predicted deacylase